jgi:hypothetical protein
MATLVGEAAVHVAGEEFFRVFDFCVFASHSFRMAGEQDQGGKGRKSASRDGLDPANVGVTARLGRRLCRSSPQTRQ